MNDELIKKTFLKMKERLPRACTCPDEDDIARFAEGMMDDKEAEKIKEHLVLCPRCCDDYVSLCVTLDKIIDLSNQETQPEAPDEQIKQVCAMVQAGKKPTHESTAESVLDRITQSIKNFFTFEWLAQPIPTAVKSSLVTVLVVLIVYTTYFYTSQQSPEIGVPSPREIPAERDDDSSRKIPEADVSLPNNNYQEAQPRSLESLFQGPQEQYREQSTQGLPRGETEKQGKVLMDPFPKTNIKALQKRRERDAEPIMNGRIQGFRAMPEMELGKETAATHYAEGFKYFQNGDYSKAEAESKGLEIDPTHEPSKKGRSYIKTKLEEHYQNGLKYFQEQNPSLAIQEWEKVARYDPDYRNTNQYLKKAYKLQERLEKLEKSNP